MANTTADHGVGPGGLGAARAELPDRAGRPPEPALRAALAAHAGGDRRPDARRAAPPGLKERLVAWALLNAHWPLAVLRLVRPALVRPGRRLAVVTRYDHVREVLLDPQAFRVPWAERMRALNDGGDTFVLGVDDPAEHAAKLARLRRAFRPEDLPGFAALCRREAEALLDGHAAAARRAGGEPPPFDAVRDLVTLSATRACATYLGIPLRPDQEHAFGRNAVAMSAWLFGVSKPGDLVEARALEAARQARPLLDEALVAARARLASGEGGDTVADRYALLLKEDPALAPDAARGDMLGMITGFVPTNTVAGGNVLDAVLPGRLLFRTWPGRRFAEPARRAVEARDEAGLRACLREVLRHCPINLGPFRVAARDHVLHGAGPFGRGRVVIPKGYTVLASTQSAMFDGRRVPACGRFDPDRRETDILQFGHGPHVCLGRGLGEAHMTAVIGALLARPGLRRAGRLRRTGPFPASLPVRFDP